LNKSEIVLSKFKIRESSGNTYQALCPAHEDKKPSLKITVLSDRILLHCFAGCRFEDILSAVNIEKKDLFLNNRKNDWNTNNYRKEKQFDYYDENGALSYSSIKKVKVSNSKEKKFTYFSYDKESKPVWNLKGIGLIPYRLPELIKAVQQGKTIYIPEGEKDVETLRYHGLESTTNPFGAGKWKPFFNHFLKGANIVILEDNDDAGRNHTNILINELSKVVSTIKLIQFQEMPEKSDVTDWLNSGHTIEELMDKVEKAPFIDLFNIDDVKSDEINNEAYLKEIQDLVYDGGSTPLHVLIIEEVLKNHNIKIVFENDKKKYIRYSEGAWNKIENGELGLTFKDFLKPKHKTNKFIKEIINGFEYTKDILVKTDELDRQDTLINLENCCYDLNAFKAIPHSAEHFFTHKLPYRYDINAKCPKFLESLKEYSGNDESWISRLQEIMGYCLTGEFDFQVMFWFYGSKGRNGKGTLLRIISQLVGKTFTLPDFDTKSIMENRFYKLRLENKRVAIGGDLAKKIHNVNTLKAITGGDEQTSDVKFGEPKSFIPKTKILFAMNSLPRIERGENKEPLRLRIIFLPFYNQIKNPNSKVEEELKSELSGIFNWAIEGLKRLKQNQKFTNHAESDNLLSQFIDDDNPEDIFVKNNLIIDENSNGIFLKEIFDRYCDFMRNYTGDIHWKRDYQNFVTTPSKLYSLIRDSYPGLITEKKYSDKFRGTHMFAKNLSFWEEKGM
jgi:putative DNA primase/helicase